MGSNPRELILEDLGFYGGLKHGLCFNDVLFLHFRTSLALLLLT